ncbi:MAG: hypothetical protein HOA29_13160 [Rhodobacteraceae bacterium]|nr:hypothetical protein [Paracoccaceae bacterium]MBT4953917.1 hypothetical protein [Paracoccaceae bacterium]MBT6898196.1 hypothetical protein [Paracoccaceae bacterium]
MFYTLREAKILIEKWPVHYKTVRPHSAIVRLRRKASCQ